jgi:RNA polymerase sigma factor for flagellar operon FliA
MMAKPPNSATQERMATIEQHLPLVQHVVFQVAVHFPRHVDREELARAGALGLIEAAHRFDADRGVPFERFAAQRIRGAILDAVRAADWAPRSLRTAARSADTTRQRLANELGRAPTGAETAAAMGITSSQLGALQDRVHRSVVLALDEYVTQDAGDDLTLVDVIVDQSSPEPSMALENRELHAYLRDAVETLPERHRMVIIGYFLEGRTSQELARFLNVTESRVSQLRSEALERLKAGISAQYASAQEEDEPVKGRVARRKVSYAAGISARSTWKDRLGRVSGADDARPTELLSQFA